MPWWHLDHIWRGNDGTRVPACANATTIMWGWGNIDLLLQFFTINEVKHTGMAQQMKTYHFLQRTRTTQTIHKTSLWHSLRCTQSLRNAFIAKFSGGNADFFVAEPLSACLMVGTISDYRTPNRTLKIPAWLGVRTPVYWWIKRKPTFQYDIYCTYLMDF